MKLSLATSPVPPSRPRIPSTPDSVVMPVAVQASILAGDFMVDPETTVVLTEEEMRPLRTWCRLAVST
jgi:hypothetical protein